MKLVNISEEALKGLILCDHIGPPEGRDFLCVVEITYQCNFQCFHCHIDATINRSEYMSYDTACRIFDEMAEIGVQIVYLSGGEPTIRKDLIRLIEYLKELHIKPGLISNGYLLDSKYIQRLKEAGLEIIGISLNGATPSTYDAFVNISGAFQRVINNIRTCVKVGIPKVLLLTTGGSPIVQSQMESIIKIAIDLGVFMVGDERPIPIGSALRNKSKIKVEKSLYYKEYLNWLKKKSKEYSNIIKIDSNDPLWGLDNKKGFIPLNEGVPNKNVPLCPSAWHVCITPDLKVKPCAFSHAFAGDLTTTSFKNIWNNSILLRAIRNKDNLKGKCGRCEYKYLCGGCRASAYAYYGDYFAEDPLCWKE